MREGKNREIRNVLRALGLQVNRLIRVSFGPFQLGELPDGAVEEVKTRTLREQLGARLAARSGADFSAEIVERDEPRRLPLPVTRRASDASLEGRRPGGRSSERAPSVVRRPLRSGRAERSPSDDRGTETTPRGLLATSVEGEATRPSQDDRSKAAPRRDDRKPKWRRPYHGKRDR